MVKHVLLISFLIKDIAEFKKFMSIVEMSSCFKRYDVFFQLVNVVLIFFSDHS